MTALPTYGKTPPKIFFSGASGPISTKFGMKHLGLRPIIVCSNDNLRLTMAYSMARSNLVVCVFEWGKLNGHLMGKTRSK